MAKKNVKKKGHIPLAVLKTRSAKLTRLIKKRGG